MDRADAWGLLTEFTASESLRKHALAVEACMRAYARKFGDDQDRWALTGLLHDFDYEKYPSAEEHPFKGSEIPCRAGGGGGGGLLALLLLPLRVPSCPAD